MRAVLLALAMGGVATGLASAAPKTPPPEPAPKVLPVAGGQLAPFLDVSLEARCDALKSFVAKFAAEHLAEAGYQEGACGEGNGIGGARYTLDFRLTPPQKPPLAYRLDVAFAGAEPRVRLCDADPPPLACSTNPPGKPLVFEAGGRFALTERAHVAALGFYAIHPNAQHLLPTVAAWVGKAASRHQIYGADYDAFVRAIVAGGVGLPLAPGAPPLKVKLVPTDPAHPATGRAVFDAAPDPSFLSCCKCGDAACLNDSVQYRFDDRFLSLSRPNPEKGAMALGAGWVISGTAPLGPEHPWTFACGVTRYSLETRQR